MNRLQFASTKSYGHDLGLSCCFRQWRAESHCRLLHGYALAFSLEFGCNQTDKNGWVVDFGSLKELKKILVDTFDHTVAVAADDPQKSHFLNLKTLGLADVRVFEDGVGCEAFALFVYRQMTRLLEANPDYQHRGVIVTKVECREHYGNSAIYYWGNHD